MLNFLSLSLTPTALIAVNHQLKVPKSFKVTSMDKPSTYKYPELMKKQEEKVKEKVETVVLSTTAKVKARTDRKNKAEGGDVEMSEAPADATKEEKKDDAPVDAKKEEVVEPDFLVLSNPTRILKAQERKVVFSQDAESRYFPVLDGRFSGFIVLRETRAARPEEVEEFYDDEERNLDAPNPDLVGDVDIPAAFEFDPLI
jgi:26S proteasome regulatory subunit N2